MSYLNFLILFVGTPLIALSYLTFRTVHKDRNYILKGIIVLCGLALVYTTPWDNYLVANQVWWYGPERVLAVIGYVPVEEYSFFILQTFLTGFWCYLLMVKSQLHFKLESHKSKSSKWFVALILFCIFIYGAFSLFHGGKNLYIGLILSWALPVILLQFLIGGQHILNNSKIFLCACLPPTIYLWLADAYAIHDNIWMISKDYTLDINLGVLPIEEMTFFLVTNIMVVQGLLLFYVMRDYVTYNFRFNIERSQK